jgi:hypothetical protein
MKVSVTFEFHSAKEAAAFLASVTKPTSTSTPTPAAVGSTQRAVLTALEAGSATTSDLSEAIYGERGPSKGMASTSRALHSLAKRGLVKKTKSLWEVVT